MPTAQSISIGKKQSIPKHLRYTFEDFNREFPDDDSCLEYIKEQRFPGGMSHCEKCGKETKHHRIADRTCYSCQFCGTQVYPLAGTIFEKSTTSLRTWFYAMYLMGSTRCGISAKQIQRETGVTYKTAWRMFRQIRTLMSEDWQLEGPTVEIDETYCGGRKYGTGRPMQEEKSDCRRGGTERPVWSKDRRDCGSATLLGLVREHVPPESTIYSYEHRGYDGIKRLRRKAESRVNAGYQHRRIHHSSKVLSPVSAGCESLSA